MDEKLVLYFTDYIPVIHKKIFKGTHRKFHEKYTRHQMHLLWMVSNNGKKPMRFFGERLLISKPNMSALVGRLEDEGLLRRVHDAEDRRKVLIEITEGGTNVLKEHGKKLHNVVKERLSVLSDEEKITLIDSFETIERILEKIEG